MALCVAKLLQAASSGFWIHDAFGRQLANRCAPLHSDTCVSLAQLPVNFTILSLQTPPYASAPAGPALAVMT